MIKTEGEATKMHEKREKPCIDFSQRDTNIGLHCPVIGGVVAATSRGLNGLTMLPTQENLPRAYS